MMKTKMGIVGASGRILGLLKRNGFHSKVEVAGIHDLSRERSERFNRELECEAIIYDDYETMLANSEIEWIAVGSINAAHARQAAAALRAGKHVFCEKPIATKMEDCEELLKARNECSGKLMVGFTLRYASHYRKIHEIIASGEIGDIMSFEFNETLDFNHGGHIMCCWRRLREFTGSHILEKCCHDIDLANWMVGSRASRVASFGALDFFKPENSRRIDELNDHPDGFRPYCQWPTAHGKNPFTIDKDIIDNQVAIIEYENGCRGTFHTNLNAGIPERRFYILGTKGALRGDLLQGDIQVKRIGFETEIENIKLEKLGGHGDGDDILTNYWLKMIYEDAPSLTDVKAGVEAALTCFALDDAMLQGRVVDMSDYWNIIDSDI